MMNDAPTPPPRNSAFSLETVGMSKIFGSLVALDDVSMKVNAGEFHALLGENGAGKSTLVKCIMGFYQPTRGQLLVGDQEVVVKTTADAQAAGIGNGLSALHAGAMPDGCREYGNLPC